MINWEIEEPEVMTDSVTLYDDDNEEREFDCTTMLLIRHQDDENRQKSTFSKGYFVKEKEEWYDAEGFQIMNVSGWYDLEKEINVEQ